MYLFSFINTQSASVTDLLVYRRKSDKVAFFLKKIIASNDWSSIQHLSADKMSPEVENTRSEATYEAYMYGARLIVWMLIDYFTCIALKIIVLEMIALIKKWTIKSLEIQNCIRF